MDLIKKLSNTDIYLIDLILKGYISENDRILDAGCGFGRNMNLFLTEGYSVQGFDPNEEAIHELQEHYPASTHSFSVDRIETFSSTTPFNFVICNAVLHFAENHAQFREQFKALTTFLSHSGILFMRMTSNIGLENTMENVKNGPNYVPDESERYLVDEGILSELLQETQLEFAEPLKTVNVNNRRWMSTLVLRKI